MFIRIQSSTNQLGKQGTQPLLGIDFLTHPSSPSQGCCITNDLVVDFREENLVPLNLAPQISNANLMIRMEMFSIELNELGIICDVNLTVRTVSYRVFLIHCSSP